VVSGRGGWGWFDEVGGDGVGLELVRGDSCVATFSFGAIGGRVECFAIAQRLTGALTKACF
jgi:hypothetical protein